MAAGRLPVRPWMPVSHLIVPRATSDLYTAHAGLPTCSKVQLGSGQVAPISPAEVAVRARGHNFTRSMRMSEQWQYQVRINVDDAPAETLRNNPDAPALAALTDILRQHDAKA